MGGIAGSWAGTYVVEQCGGSTGSITTCCARRRIPRDAAGIAHVGATLPIAMELTVNGADVTGVVTFGSIRGTLTGMDRGAGYFLLQGMIEGAAGALNITHWDAPVQRDEMQGFIAYQVRLAGVPGIGPWRTKLRRT